jgi:hypothetical protein
MYFLEMFIFSPIAFWSATPSAGLRGLKGQLTYQSSKLLYLPQAIESMVVVQRRIQASVESGMSGHCRSTLGEALRQFRQSQNREFSIRYPGELAQDGNRQACDSASLPAMRQQKFGGGRRGLSRAVMPAWKES